MVTIRKAQSGFVTLSLGFALLALFGTISLGIESAHNGTEQQQVSQAEGDIQSAATRSER